MIFSLSSVTCLTTLMLPENIPIQSSRLKGVSKIIRLPRCLSARKIFSTTVLLLGSQIICSPQVISFLSLFCQCFCIKILAECISQFPRLALHRSPVLIQYSRVTKVLAPSDRVIGQECPQFTTLYVLLSLN